MGKEKNPRRVAENEAVAKGRNLKGSVQKYNLLAQQIRGKRVQRALDELEFSRRRGAIDVRKILYSAVSNAENTHGLDADELIVAEAYVGKSMTLKRGRPRARGRYARIFKHFSEVTVIVREVEEEEAS